MMITFGLLLYFCLVLSVCVCWCVSSILMCLNGGRRNDTNRLNNNGCLRVFLVQQLDAIRVDAMRKGFDQLRATQRFARMRTIAVDQTTLLITTWWSLVLRWSVLEATANIVQLCEMWLHSN